VVLRQTDAPTAGLLPSELHNRHWHIITLRSDPSHFSAIGLIVTADEAPSGVEKKSIISPIYDSTGGSGCRSKCFARLANH